MVDLTMPRGNEVPVGSRGVRAGLARLSGAVPGSKRRDEPRFNQR